jgi:hypothetical protein
MKTDAERLADTKQYLSNHITPAQFDEVMNLLAAAPHRNAIPAALSVGHSNPFNTAGRRAKRCLMLLASLFIGNSQQRDNEMRRIKNLPEGSAWPLIAEIKSWFILPGITPELVAMNARNNIGKMPTWNNVSYKAADAARGVYHNDKPFNCYNAWVFWAFQAGAISKRYLWNEMQGKDGNAFFPTYSRVGWTKLIEYGPAKNLLKDDSGGGEVIVPAGRTVYFETPTKVFGHIACSLGDGRVISQNSVNIGDIVMRRLPGPVKAEFEKMANAITHVVSIRDLLTHYFNPDHGYQSLQVSNGAFWEPIPTDKR